MFLLFIGVRNTINGLPKVGTGVSNYGELIMRQNWQDMEHRQRKNPANVESRMQFKIQ